jgi:hypothetical protein
MAAVVYEVIQHFGTLGLRLSAFQHGGCAALSATQQGHAHEKAD